MDGLGLAFCRSCLFNWWRFGGAERRPGDEFRDGAVPRPRVATGVGTGWPEVTQSGGGNGSDLGCLHRQDVQNLSVAFSNDARDATEKMVKFFFVPSGARRKKEDVDVHKLNWRWNVGELQSYTIVDGKQIRGTRWVGSVSHYWHRSCTFIARISSINDSPESQN